MCGHYGEVNSTLSAGLEEIRMRNIKKMVVYLLRFTTQELAKLPLYYGIH